MELRQYLEILKRHKWFVIEAAVAATVLVGVLSALRAPTYRASTRVLLHPDDPAEQVNPDQAPRAYRDPNRYVDAQKDIVRSEGVASAAARQLSGVTVKDVKEKVSVGSGDQSDVITVSAVDTDKRRARDIANAVARSYIENRRQYAVEGLRTAVDEITAKLGPLQTTIADLDARIAGLDGSQPRSSTTTSPPTTAAGVGPGGLVLGTTPEALKTARDAAAVQYESLFNRQQELLVNITLKRGEAEIISEAGTPTSPVSPKPVRDGIFGGIVGLLLGTGVSLVREQMDDRFRSADEIEKSLAVPVLAQLPYDDDSVSDSAQVAAITRPSAPVSEAARSLRTSIQYFDLDRPLKVIVVTSAAPSEGKSLVSANLAAVYAQAGQRTMLVSADLRKLGVVRYFPGRNGSQGLTGVVAQIGDRSRDPGATNGTPPSNGAVGTSPEPAGAAGTVLSSIRTAVQPTMLPNLAFLPPGPVPPNPAELLNSQRMTQVLAELERAADVVIVDTPPLLPVTDAAVVAARADAVVLVTAIGETRRDAARRAKAIVESTGARLLGVVVNKAPTTGAGYYYGGYYEDSRTEVPKRRNLLGRRRRAEPRPT